MTLSARRGVPDPCLLVVDASLGRDVCGVLRRAGAEVVYVPDVFLRDSSGEPIRDEFGSRVCIRTQKDGEIGLEMEDRYRGRRFTIITADRGFAGNYREAVPINRRGAVAYLAGVQQDETRKRTRVLYWLRYIQNLMPGEDRTFGPPP